VIDEYYINLLKIGGAFVAFLCFYVWLEWWSAKGGDEDDEERDKGVPPIYIPRRHDDR